MLEKPYMDLCCAIVAQAVKDYRDAYKMRDESEMKSIERFFNGDWFMMLSDLDGSYVIDAIKKAAEEDRLDCALRRYVNGEDE